jgi:hypothetical protein
VEPHLLTFSSNIAPNATTVFLTVTITATTFAGGASGSRQSCAISLHFSTFARLSEHRAMFVSPSSVRRDRFRRATLHLQTLDERTLPAGAITATLSTSGLLTILGDDAANVVTLQVNPGNVVLTPDANTTINTAAIGVPVTLTGAASSIKADLKGGDDSLNIDPASPFKVTGSVSFTLGDGDNTLDLTTSEAITLGSLTVKGGDGFDSVTLQPGIGLGSRVSGPATFSYSSGGSDTSLNDTDFGSSMKLTTGDAVATGNSFEATTVSVLKTITADLGNSNPGVASFLDCTLGGLTLTGQSVTGVLAGAMVNGSVSVKGGFAADLEVDTAVVTKNVTLTAPTASFNASGDGTTINGNLTLTSTAFTETSFQTATLSEVKGSITVKGGWFDDTFDANSQFKAKNVSLTLNGGDNSVSIGDPTAVATISGNLKISTGSGSDSIAFSRVGLTGTVSISTSGGNDLLSIEDDSTFAKTFTADLGSGDDTISIAQNPTADAGAVFFTGAVKIVAGTGNDTLLLGLAAAAGGDADSSVKFLAPTNSIDGGAGFNTFDPSLSVSQFTGVSPIGWGP